MGAYLELPATENKLDWLEKNGKLILTPTWEETLAMEKELTLPVAWLDNGGWDCIFIVCSYNDLFRATKNPDDVRPRCWYRLSITLIKGNSSGFRHYYSGALQAPPS